LSAGAELRFNDFINNRTTSAIKDTKAKILKKTRYDFSSDLKPTESLFINNYQKWTENILAIEFVPTLPLPEVSLTMTLNQKESEQTNYFQKEVKQNNYSKTDILESGCSMGINLDNQNDLINSFLNINNELDQNQKIQIGEKNSNIPIEPIINIKKIDVNNQVPDHVLESLLTEQKLNILNKNVNQPNSTNEIINIANEKKDIYDIIKYPSNENMASFRADALVVDNSTHINHEFTHSIILQEDSEKEDIPKKQCIPQEKLIYINERKNISSSTNNLFSSKQLNQKTIDPKIYPKVQLNII